MTKKDVPTYRRAIKALLPNYQNMKVAQFLGDWEKAPWIIIREMFGERSGHQHPVPEKGLQMCDYHYKANIRKLAKINGKVGIAIR